MTMHLDVEKTGRAGRDVLAFRDQVVADQTAHAFVEAQSGLRGLSICEGLGQAQERYKGFQKRFSGELDYIGNVVVAASRIVDATDEQGGESFEQLDVSR